VVFLTFFFVALKKFSASSRKLLESSQIITPNISKTSSSYLQTMAERTFAALLNQSSGSK